MQESIYRNARVWRHRDERNGSYFQWRPIVFIAAMATGRKLCISWAFWTVELFTVQRWEGQ